MMYLAANQDAILEASKMGIDAGRAINYTESTECTKAVYRSAARVASDGRHDTGMLSLVNRSEQASHQRLHRHPHSHHIHIHKL